jgi:LDH2 family malate/lactate/ureidoglycolate dehydrogenase
MYKLYNVKGWGSMAPHCGCERLLSTNPLAIGIPRRGDPFVLWPAGISFGRLLGSECARSGCLARGMALNWRNGRPFTTSGLMAGRLVSPIALGVRAACSGVGNASIRMTPSSSPS